MRWALHYPWVVLTMEVCLWGITDQQTTTTGGPYIMNGPKNMTAVEGQRVLFNCGAEAFPDNITYYWYKDGTDVRMLPVFNKRLTLTEGKLLLTGVVKEDMGWYTCRPSNGIGQDEASAYLNVTYLPRVIVEKMPVQVRWAKGFMEKLDCPVDANPPMTDTMWTKGQSTLDSSGRIDILLNGSLLVSNVKEEDAGTYFCTPVSALGSGQISPNVQVIVRDPPYFTLRPDPLYSKLVGQSLLMPCAASGTPTPSIMWKKVGGVIDLSSPRIRQDGGNLSISSTTKMDHGKYECVASNTIATIVESTEVKILNTTPHAPYNVTVIPGLFQADITWSPADDGGKPQFYMLWFRQVGGQWNQLTIPGPSTSFTMYNLQPDTEYEFMVLSRNELGNGSFSKSVKASTLDPDRKNRPRSTTVRADGYNPDLVTALPMDENGEPYIPNVTRPLGPLPTQPRNVSTTLRNGNNVLITWLPPVNSPVPVFWYDVDYRSPPGSNNVWSRYNGHVMHTSPTRMELEGLEPGLYEIRVVAYGVLAYMSSSSVVVDIPADGRLIPDAMIGGIVGGVLFLLVAVLLTTMAIIHSRRKDSKSRNGATNYADVSYGKPEDVNSKIQQAPPKRDRWQQNGGGDIVTSLGNTDSIFFLPQPRDPHMTSDPNSTLGRDPRRRYDLDPVYQNDPSYQVTRSPPARPVYVERDPFPGSVRGPHTPLSYQGSQPLIVNDQEPLVSSMPRPRSRSHPSERSHRYPSDPYDPRSPLPRQGELGYPEYPYRYPRESDYPYPRLPPSQPPPPYRSSGGSGGSDYPPKPARVYDRPQRDSDRRGPDGPQRPLRGYDGPMRGEEEPHRSPGYVGPQRGGYDGPFQSFQSDDDDVFPPGSHPSAPPLSGRPGSLPRHSSMKPGLQTYLTEEEPPAFTVGDISSVLDPPQDQSTLPHHSHPHSSLPPPRRSWQPSQESSRSNQPPSYSVDVSGEGRSPPAGLGDKPLARVWPSPKTADDSSDSSGRPLGYTRDQLHDVVDRLRHAPRSRSAPGDRYLDVSAQGSVKGSGRDLHSPYRREGSEPPPGERGRQSPAALPHGYPPSHAPLGQRYPEDSTSSGIGSRNTSQSTSGSLRPRPKPSGNSLSSLLTPQESSLADSSHPYLDPYNSLRRDTSADENYEFDHLPALEDDILDDLQRYSRLAGAGNRGQVPPGEVMRELYPKPRRQSQYANANERFQKLREEFHQYRQQQESNSPPYSGPPQRSTPPSQQEPLYPMDSEML
ncbi:hypothetical protein V1264_017214 [Littorina saxatilis]|uniref:Uncharacterized protein n=1 Tax=Littorina saxatilis TaxID=31220 RepID=A0AAN9BI36_9CAEN